MTEQRRLAAVMFTGINGCTDMMTDKPVKDEHSERIDAAGLHNISKNVSPLR